MANKYCYLSGSNSWHEIKITFIETGCRRSRENSTQKLEKFPFNCLDLIQKLLNLRKKIYQLSWAFKIHGKKNYHHFKLINHSLTFKSKYHFWRWPCICESILCSSEGTVPVLSLIFFGLQCVFSSNTEKNVKPQKLKPTNTGGKWKQF